MAETTNTRKRKSEPADLTLLHLKELKTLDSPFGETASFSPEQHIVPVNLPANENQKPEPTLPNENQKPEPNGLEEKPCGLEEKPSGLEQKSCGLEEKPSVLEEKPETVSLLESSPKNKKKKTKGFKFHTTVSLLESSPKNKQKKNRGFKFHTTRQMFNEQWKGSFYVKDKCFDELLEKISRSIEAMEQPKKEMAFKIWMKQYFSVGVNEVTRMLERMPAASDKTLESYISDFKCPKCPFSNVQGGVEESLPNKDIIGSETETQGQKKLLQAVLIAVDCHPCALVSHFPSLASSRGVPLFSVKNHGSCAEQLGVLLKVKTAIAIGVKVGESPINKAIQDAIADQVSRLNSNVACESQEMTTE